MTEKFFGRDILRNADVNWLPRSSALTKLYSELDLKAEIIFRVSEIEPQLTQNV